MNFLLTPDTWIAFITLTFLEIVLGIDNVIFISLVTGKLPEEQRKKTTDLGLLITMVLRIALLLGISVLTSMENRLFIIELGGFSAKITVQSLILLVGGFFLIYKSTKGIHEKVDYKGDETQSLKNTAAKAISGVMLQILLIDMIFSVDSIITAVGMANGLSGALYIMIAAVTISVIVMMFFAAPLGCFINRNPSLQILGLSFLILIGFVLITESMYLANAQLGGKYVAPIPRGYLYMVIIFSLLVAIVHMRIRKAKPKN